MKTKILLFCFSICLLCSCNRTQNKTAQILTSDVPIENIVIDIEKNVELSYDSLIAKAEFIKLETNETNLIGQISQILFVDSLIVVVDNQSAKSINVFDIKGKFKCNIGRIGNGPKEFVEISNVVVVPERNLLCVLDRPQKKILYFDLNGQFISYERQPFMLDYFEYIDTEHKAFEVIGMYDYAYGKNRGNSLIVADKSNDIIYGAFKDTYRENFYFIINRPLKKFAEQLFFSPNLSDSIYIIEKDRIIPKYHIDIKTNRMPDIDRNKITKEEFSNYQKRCFFFNGDFVELEDFTFVNIATPWGYPFAIYSHQTQKVFLTTGESTKPLYAFCIYEPITRYKENGLVFAADAYVLIDDKENLYTMKKYKNELDELYEGLDENSNPVLFIYHLNTNLGK